MPDTTPDTLYPQYLYWIGGAPCAGKSTISNIIAQEFGWRVYSIDRFVESYLERATPDEQPHLVTYREQGLRQFLLQLPDVQLEQVHGISQEQLTFIVEDLAQWQAENATTPILIEGATLSAPQIATYLPSPQHAIWLVPTEDFVLETYPNRGSWVQDVLRQHYQPQEGIIAFERWMERDAQWAKLTSEQAQSQQIPIITVDGKTPLLDNAERVMQYFGLI